MVSKRKSWTHIIHLFLFWPFRQVFKPDSIYILYHILLRYVKKGPYAICEQRRSIWECAPVQSGLDVVCSLTYTRVSIHSVGWQQRPRSACANAGPALSANLQSPFLSACICIVAIKCHVSLVSFAVRNNSFDDAGIEHLKLQSDLWYCMPLLQNLN